MSIVWTGQKDLHIKGSSSFGDLWIRLTKTGLVTGVYTMFGETRKFTPVGEDWDVADSKIIAELAIEDHKLKLNRDEQRRIQRIM